MKDEPLLVASLQKAIALLEQIGSPDPVIRVFVSKTVGDKIMQACVIDVLIAFPTFGKLEVINNTLLPEGSYLMEYRNHFVFVKADASETIIKKPDWDLQKMRPL